jgi:hypothetical protein
MGPEKMRAAVRKYLDQRMPKGARNGPPREEHKARSLSKEQELVRRYPDLKKKTSEFFKATARRYGRFVQAGVPPTEAMVIAAEETAAQFIREGKISASPSLD